MRGECAAKWRGIHGSANPVTGGTIVQMARENGWAPRPGGGPMDWDGPISAGEAAAGPEPERQLIQYLRALFKPDEFVGYVTKSWRREDEKGVQWIPSKGHWDRTAGQLIKALEKCGGDIGSTLGDWAPEEGAWIRFNPLDGKGCKDKNVTGFRHALVECDELPVEEQLALIKKLNLPVACLTHSGKRSLHAVVRVDASDYEEHQSRVRLLYEICKENGLKVDAQNKNPSRLSRMPGVTRNGKEQSLIAVNMGARGWDEWLAFMECDYDGLPEPEGLEEVWDNMPDLAPCLIENALRMGHKMLIAGPSKAGKSFLLIELCVAIAEGRRWLGWKYAPARIFSTRTMWTRAICPGMTGMETSRL